MTPTDRVRTRTVRNLVAQVQEHLEAMQRDMHGLEYRPWKREVDELWKRVFQQITHMRAGPQKTSLEEIREPWTHYLTYYTEVGP